MTIPSSNYQNLSEKQRDQMVQLLDTAYTSLASINSKLASATPAGEAHIGEVGGNTGIIAVTPTVSLVAYTANDCVGGGFAIPGAVRVNGGTGILQSITVQDLSAQNALLGFFFFKATSLATYTDNSALDISDTDLGNCIGWVSLVTSNYCALSDNSIGCVRNLGLPLQAYTGTKSIYCVVRTNSAATFATSNDLKFIFGIFRD
jgi:hypothetical protein